MINSIIEAIKNSLNEEFGDGYEIMTEESRQDLNKSCFFISCLNQTTKLFLGTRYFYQNQFSVQYFPNSETAREECNTVAERLMCCLELICVSQEWMRGTKMRYEVEEGSLHFSVNYDCYVYRVKENTAMETIEKSQNVKG